MRIKKIITLSLVTLATVSTLTACGSLAKEVQKQQEKQAQMIKAASEQEGQEAPDFELKDLDGNIVKLSDLKGKKVYLKFWASWCGPCLASLPEFEEMAQKKEDNLVVLSMAAPGYGNEQKEDEFRKWFAEQDHKNFPVLLDSQDGKNFQAYKIQAFPTEYFIDSEGKVAKVRLGAVPNSEAETIIKEMK